MFLCPRDLWLVPLSFLTQCFLVLDLLIFMGFFWPLCLRRYSYLRSRKPRHASASDLVVRWSILFSTCPRSRLILSWWFCESFRPKHIWDTQFLNSLSFDVNSGMVPNFKSCIVSLRWHSFVNFTSSGSLNAFSNFLEFWSYISLLDSYPSRSTRHTLYMSSFLNCDNWWSSSISSSSF